MSHETDQMDGELSVTFHEKAAARFDERGSALVALVRESSEASPRAKAFVPDVHVAATISRKELGDFWSKGEMPDGTVTRRTLHRGGTEFGVDGEAAEEVSKIAESMLGQKGVPDLVSRERMEEHVFQWACWTHLGEEERSLSKYVLAMIEEEAVERMIWIPIAETYIECDVRLGHVILRTLDAAWFDKLVDMVRANYHEAAIAPMEAKIQAWRRDLQGAAAATCTVRAERQRADEIAYERTEAALSVLRFFSKAAMHAPFVSTTAPYGMHPRRDFLHFALLDGNRFEPVQGTNLRSSGWAIGREQLRTYGGMGLGLLDAMLRVEKPNEYQEALLNAIRIYGRAALETDLGDKLLLVVGALESFLLRDGSEAIVDNVSFRLAVVVGETVEHRQEIIRTYKAAYALRSGLVHHGRTLAERGAVRDFYRYAYLFMVQAIVASQHHTTRATFFDDLERRKLSG